MTKEFNKSGFGSRLAEALAYLGITQRDFAAAIGVHAPNVSMWISGKLDFWNAESFIKAQCAYPNVNFFYVSGGPDYGKLTDVTLSYAFYQASEKVGVLPTADNPERDEKETLVSKIKELDATIKIYKSTLERYKATIDNYEEQLKLR